MLYPCSRKAIPNTDEMQLSYDVYNYIILRYILSMYMGKEHCKWVQNMSHKPGVKTQVDSCPNYKT